MTLHREGFGLIALAVAVGVGLVALTSWLGAPAWAVNLVTALALVDVVLVAQFFRVPKRVPIASQGQILCPSDYTGCITHTRLWLHDDQNHLAPSSMHTKMPSFLNSFRGGLHSEKTATFEHSLFFAYETLASTCSPCQLAECQSVPMPRRLNPA